MLYDKHRNAPIAIPCAGLAADDLAAFCKEMDIEFFAVGSPENWSDPEVFRAGTIDYPARGLTVRFTKVLEWKAAAAAIGPRIFEGGRYRHFEGGFWTTVGEATDAAGTAVVVYRDNEWRLRTLPTKDFFSVVNQAGKLVARVAHCSG